MKSGMVNPLRVVIKAMVLFLLFNIVFTVSDLPWGNFSIYNLVVPGRVRVPYEQEAKYYQPAHNLPVFEDFDAMFASHEISREKTENEYRVIMLGDSSTWGFLLPPEQTFSVRMNLNTLVNCEGRFIHIYNLAFPLPDVVKDLLILDRALSYQPDMVIWFLTENSVKYKTISKNLISNHSERSREIFDQYDLELAFAEHLPEETFWDRTLFAKRRTLKKIIILQLYGLMWAATGDDFYIRDYVPAPISENDQEVDGFRSEDTEQKLNFDVLKTGVKMSGDVEFVFVNEPIFISSGRNSDIQYNSLYSRQRYDQYRSRMESWMNEQGYIYIDLWNALPQNAFSDGPLHRTPEGEMLLSTILTPAVQSAACP